MPTKRRPITRTAAPADSTLQRIHIECAGCLLASAHPVACECGLRDEHGNERIDEIVAIVRRLGIPKEEVHPFYWDDCGFDGD